MRGEGVAKVMARMHIYTNRLRNNMILGADVYTSSGIILVPEGTRINDDIRRLLERHFIDQVVVSFDESRRVGSSPVQMTQTEHFQNFEKKFEIAKEDISNSLNDFVFKEREINVEQMLGTLNAIIEQSNNSVDLCDMLFRMKSDSDTIYTHSVNTALLSQLIAGWMGMSTSEKEILSILGLVHDIGKLKLPKEILAKDVLLTKKETALFETHVIEGYKIIKNKQIDNQIKQALLTHHERLDGTGYPLHINAKQITKFSRILAVADMYDLMISGLQGGETLCPFEVVHIFESEGMHKYDSEVLMIFLSKILDPFINRQVLLSNGMKGQVVFINKADLSRPLVRTEKGFLDLCVNPRIKIKKILDD